MKATLLFILSILFSSSVFSNGGPLDHGYLRKTGNIRLLRKADVKLISENLEIKVEGDYTIVNVIYQLQNKGGGQKIQYGFPVDAYAPEWTFGDYSGEPGANETLKYFKVSANDLPLKVSQWIVDSAYSAQSISIYRGKYRNAGEKYNIHRKWSAVTLQFDSLETKMLRVKYKVKNLLSDRYPGFSSFPTFSERHFTYHLTPSSNWGDGVVERFKVTIDVSKLKQNEIDMSIFGLDGLIYDGNVYSFEKDSYDLKQSDRIHIHYDPNHIKRKGMLEDRLLANSAVKSIKTSSSFLKNHLIDGDYTTSWKCEKGDWIELRFDTITLLGMTMLNGNYNDSALLENSGIVTKMMVIVNDSLVYTMAPWLDDDKYKIITIDKPIYGSNIDDCKIGFSQNIAEGVPFNSQRGTYKVRIKILEIDSPNEYAEISELFLIGRKRKRILLLQ